MPDKTILLMIAMVLLTGWLLCRKKIAAVKPAQTAMPAPVHTQPAPPAEEEDELMVAAMAAAAMLCLPGEYIRRITPRSYEEFYYYTVELISAD